MKKKTPPKTLETRSEELEQYDSRWEDAVMEKKERKYAECIGTFLIWFSTLEHSLDIEVANLINERGHDQGYTIIKSLGVHEKIELFYNLAFPMIAHSPKGKSQKINELSHINQQLNNLTTLRNKIAHAKWNTLSKDGYVRTDMKTNKKNGLIEFRRFKITPTIIKQGIKELKILAEQIEDFVESIWI